jgi:hypothetical protein
LLPPTPQVDSVLLVVAQLRLVIQSIMHRHPKLPVLFFDVHASVSILDGTVIDPVSRWRLCATRPPWHSARSEWKRRYRCRSAWVLESMVRIDLIASIPGHSRSVALSPT